MGRLSAHQNPHTVISDELRAILQLPARMGMGFLNPSESNCEYENSKLVTSQLAEAIYQQHPRYMVDEETQDKGIEELRKRKEARRKKQKEHVNARLSEKRGELFFSAQRKVHLLG